MPVIDLDVMDGHASYSRNAVGLASSMSSVPVMVNDMPELVRAVVSRCNDGDLRRLRVFGHGSAGVQGLGNEVNATTGTRLSLTPRAGISWEWAMLCTVAHCFGRDGWLELHGCNVGDGLAGKNYVVGLARILGVPVRAGRGTQFTGAQTTHTFENLWIEATPEPGNQISVREHHAVSNGDLLRAWHP